MDMKQIIKLFLVLSLVLLASCSTQQRVVYRDCDCNNSNYRFGWDTYWGWNSYRFWGWNDPLWGWNDPFWGWNRWNWHYNRPIIVYPKEPTRYERRQSIGARPSRNNQYRSDDNLYPGLSQPSRVQNRVESPSRVQNNTPSRVDNVYPQRTPHMQNMDMDYTQQQSRPVYRNSTPSRVQSNPTKTTQQRTTQPSRVETPSRVQQRQNTPVTTQPTRSRVQNREN
jgi:hypothetical protein